MHLLKYQCWIQQIFQQQKMIEGCFNFLNLLPDSNKSVHNIIYDEKSCFVIHDD